MISSMKSRIFATPTEPVFNLKEFALSPNLLEESLHILAEENEKSIDAILETDKFGLFKDGHPIGMIKANNQVNANCTLKRIKYCTTF